MSSYLDLLKERAVIFDGALATNLQMLGLRSDDFGGAAYEGCYEILASSHPEILQQLHAQFLDVGVDVIETCSFGALSVVLAEYQIADRAFELSRRSAELAVEVARSYSRGDRRRFVAGSMGPSTKAPSLGQIRFADLRDAYEIQATGLLEGGVDLLVIETVFDLLGAKAAIIASRRAMATTGRHVPIQVQVTIELTGRMLPGTEIGAALCSLEAMKPDVIGLNCATGPEEMYEPLRYLAGHSRLPISTLPNAGLPSIVDGKMHYDLSPEQLAEHLFHFVSELGISVVGGCCGTTPAHLQRVVDRCFGIVPKRRSPDHEPGAASLYSFVPFRQELSFLAIGERTNANGSLKFRQAMLSGDFETTTAMAKEQIKEGSHLLDVCVDYTGADGPRDMDEVMSRIATQSSVPVVIDSTEPHVVESALEWIGGRAVLNSVNLEDGDGVGTRLDRFFSLAREHGAAVICTCIDEEGQARTAEWKLRAARSIHELAIHRYGLSSEDLFFDPLALPLSTGMQESRRDGIETIEGIRAIKRELPGVFTVIGLSNVSFGLSAAARVVLNSVFLHECIEAGLDAAIAHAARIVPLHKIDDETRRICLDLIYDRRSDGYDPLKELLARFEGVVRHSSEKEDRSSWTIERRLSQRIIDGDKNGLEEELDQALLIHSALEIVNDTLLEGMKTVGELFASGEMQLPFVLQSAETMKAAVSYLEPFMERNASDGGRGKIVLATVKGDVHDIGKNLVDIIFSNNGFEVYNLGIKVGVNEMLEKAEEVKADAIGMSGLLVKSTLIMRENLEEMNRRSAFDIPVLLGGAALTRSYVEQDLRAIYRGRVFYGKDAFEGLATIQRLMEIKSSGIEDPSFGSERSGRILPARNSERHARVDAASVPDRSPEVALDNEIFDPPFLGSRVAKGIGLDEISKFLNETSLFRNQWGYRPENGESDLEFKERVRAQLRRRLDEAKLSDVLIPQVTWGYFPVNSVGNDLLVYADVERREELTRFSFPRQRVAPYLSIADFFRPLATGEIDYAGFSVSTVGAKASQAAQELFQSDRYLDYVALHGLSVEMTEALAELWHRRMREEWGFADEDGPNVLGLFRQRYRGGRYSFGYPACPSLEDNVKVVEILDAWRIGVTVSEGFQLEPEQTTLAIICHHPRAKYFVA